MKPAIISSFALGLIFGAVATAAVSINELNRLRKLLFFKYSEDESDTVEMVEN